MNKFITLLKIETKLTVRDGNVLFFGVAMPVAVMLLAGFVIPATAVTGAFSGIVGIGICATGFMGLPVVLAQYRHDGILERYHVTPVSPSILILIDALLDVAFTLIAGLLICIVATLLFGVHIADIPLFILTYLFNMFVIYSIGCLIGSLAPDIKTATTVGSLIYFPSMLVSGTTIPFTMLPHGIQIFARIFPMTQINLIMADAVTGSSLTGQTLRFIVLALAALSCYAVSVKIFRWN